MHAQTRGSEPLALRRGDSPASRSQPTSSGSRSSPPVGLAALAEALGVVEEQPFLGQLHLVDRLELVVEVDA